MIEIPYILSSENKEFFSIWSENSEEVLIKVKTLRNLFATKSVVNSKKAAKVEVMITANKSYLNFLLDIFQRKIYNSIWLFFFKNFGFLKNI